MLRHYAKITDALKCLRTDHGGVVSFEYVIVAACIITAVAAAFNIGASNTIKDALTAAITAVTTAVATAVGN